MTEGRTSRGDALLKQTISSASWAGVHGRRHAAQQGNSPAWVKRKMLSTRGAIPPWSDPSERCADRVPGGSSIWPKTRAVLSKTPALFHFADKVVRPSRVPLADAGEHGDAAGPLRAGSSPDEDGLTDARAAEEANLPWARGQKLMITLMPVSSILVRARAGLKVILT